MSAQNTTHVPTPGFGDTPLRVGSSFSRPAALIGGATALIALTAIATTLVVKPAHQVADPAGDARGATVAAQSLMSTPANNKVSGSVSGDDGVPAKTAPVASAKHSGTSTTAAQPAKQHLATAACTGCGVVESVTPFQKKGEGTGVGAVGGAVLGGVLGHQMGGGKGRDAMTAIGVVGGGIAGHEVEKRARATTLYNVKVRMEDGTVRTLTQSTAPTVGQKVTLEGSQLKTRA